MLLARQSVDNVVVDGDLDGLHVIRAGSGDELGLRDIQRVLLEGSECRLLVSDFLADSLAERAVALRNEILDVLVLVHLGGNDEACGEGIHAGDVCAEEVFLGEGRTTRLGIEVEAAARADAALGENLPHDRGGLVEVNRELVDVPADELVALVGIDGAEHAGIAGDADLVLEGVASEVGVVALEVELEVLVQAVRLQERDGGRGVEVVLVGGGLLRLGSMRNWPSKPISLA